MAVTIQCEKCGAPGTPEHAECAKCKGRVVRTCGDCGLKNSLAKKFCDQCGAGIAGASSPPPSPAAAAPPRAPEPKPVEKFEFETLAESAANELEARQRKNPIPRPATKPPQIKLPDPAARKPEPAPPPPPLPPPAPVIPPVGLNALPGLRLDVPREPSEPPPQKPDLGLPHTVIGRAIPSPGEAKPPAMAPEPARKEERASPPPPRHPSGAKESPLGHPSGAKESPLGHPSGAKESPLGHPAPKAPESPSSGKPAAPGPPAAKGDGARRVASLGRARELVEATTGAKLSTALALALLIAGAALFAARRQHLRRSEVQVPITARRYLAAIKAGDFDTARRMMTEAAQRTATLDDLKKAREGLSWDFSDVALASVDGDVSFARYKLRVDGREPSDEILVLKREGDGWRRPFASNLLRDAEAHLERGDAAQAFAAARAAQAVAERDPLPRVYACEALHLIRDPSRSEELEKECRAALELAERWPEEAAPPLPVLNHVRMVLGDVLKNGLRRYREAADQFTAVLTFGRPSAAEQCELLLGRAECWLALQDFPNALQDFSKAGSSCERPSDTEHARRALAIYSGAADKDAVQLAQQHPMGDDQTAIQWRHEERVRLTSEWREQGRGPLPPEDWQAQHLAGSQYRVDVKAGKAVLFSARVDLWTKVVQVETR